MNNYKSIIALLAVFTGVFSFLVSSCDITNPTDGLEVRLKTISRTSQVVVNFRDGKTGETVNSPIKVKFEGKDGSKVISDVNEPMSSVTVTEGTTIFSITDGIIITRDNPIEVVVLVEASGYILTSKRLELTSPYSVFDIIMTNVSAPPAGVVSKETTAGTVSNANTGTTDPIVVTSGEEPTSGGAATVTIPAGTVLKDANGNALAGNIKTRVTYYNPNNEQSLQSFPGGLNGVQVQNSDGSESEVNFVSAGFVSIDMEVNGTSVEQFGGSSGGIEVELSIPAGTQNPETGQAVKTGDKIPLWSYDEDSGEWTQEGIATVTVEGKSAKPVVKIGKMKHLSYWNLDWFYSDYCRYGKTITYSGCFDYAYVKFFDKNTNTYLFNYSYYVYGNPDYRELTFMYAPQGKDIRLEFYKEYVAQNLIGTADIGDLCQQTTVTIDAAQFGFTEITVQLVAKCTNTNPVRTVYPQGKTLWYKKKSGNSWTSAGQVNAEGKIKICLLPDTDYDFASYLDGKYYFSWDYPDAPTRITPGKSNYVFTIENPDVGNFCN